MNKGKKLTAVVAAAATTAAMVAPAFAADASSFTDIDGSYAKDAITSLVAKGIIHGVDATHFNPTAKITREDFSIILANALGLDVSSAPATPSFSDLPTTHYAYKYVEALHKAGIISGVSATEFGTGANITRQDMAALYVRALGVDVTGKASTLTFADKDQIASYAQDAVGYAVEAGLFHGMDATHFAPTANATREQVALVAAKFLDVKASLATAKLTSATFVDNNTVTLSFDKAVDKLDASDVAVAVKATGAAVNVTGVTLSDDKKTATVKVATLSAGTTYTVKVGDNSVDFTSAAKTTVASVTALNLKQIAVTFTGKVDQASVESEGNYTLSTTSTASGTAVTSLDSATTKTDAPKLQADGKTVIITLGANRTLINQGKYTLATANLKDANGVAVDAASVDFNAFDNSVPEAKDVTVVGPNSLKVTFSEPINNADATFKVDGGSVSATVNAPVISGTEYSVTLNIGTGLAEGAHTLEVAGQTGFNGYAVQDKTLNFTYTKDTVAPTVSVESVGLVPAASGNGNINSQVVFKFSKPVLTDGANLSHANIYAVYNGVAQYQANPVVIKADEATQFVSNGQTYADTFTATFGQVFPTGNVTFYVDNADDTDTTQQIADAWGNLFTTATVTGTNSIDTVKPVVSSALYDGTNHVINLTASEAIDPTTLANHLNYTLVKADGTPVTGGGFDTAGHPILGISQDPTTHVISIPVTSLPAGTLTLKLTALNDVAVPVENTMNDTSVSFDVADTTVPTATSALYTSDQKSLVVYFGKAMDASSIADLNNYEINGHLLSSVTGATATVLSGNSAVKFTFSSVNADLTGTYNLFYHVKDAQGNYTALDAHVAVTPDAITNSNLISSSEQATATDTVTFAVNQPLSGINANLITFDGETAGQAYYMNQKVTQDDGTVVDGAVVTVKLPTTANVADKLYTNALKAGTTPANISLAAGALTNQYGTLSSAISFSGVADAIAPVINGAVEDRQADANGVNHLSDVMVTFSEPIQNASVGINSFTVAGYTVTDVEPDHPTTVGGVTAASTYKVVLKQNTWDDTSLTPTVTLVKDAQDVAGNVIKGGTNQKATPTKNF